MINDANSKYFILIIIIITLQYSSIGHISKQVKQLGPGALFLGGSFLLTKTMTNTFYMVNTYIDLTNINQL